jgi:hypothetical protein
MPLDLAALFAQMDAEEAAKKDAISRRNVLLGITFLAAPAVIRCSSNLMPVRSGPQKYDEHGFRNWKAYPPSLAEVKQWRAGLKWQHEQGIMVSWSAEGFNRIHHMAGAERRFEAMGSI